MHFLQESYKFLQESQLLKICYNVERFLQESYNILTKFAYIRKKFLQKIRVKSTKNSKIIKLPASTGTFTVYNEQTVSAKSSL